MKVIAYSFYENPEVFSARNMRQAKRIATRIKNEQRKPEILTEKGYRATVECLFFAN